jgi:predicted  nucleic acid-binding Zn-ribbon protein
MDSFFDQLSEKVNAQEMIRANGQAESEAMEAVRVQVTEYKTCLDRMTGICQELGGIRDQMAALPDHQAEGCVSDAAIADLKSRLEELTKESDERLQRIAELQESLEGKMGSRDDFHNECVRLYRNVQSVVKEETEKTSEALTAEVKSLTGRSKATLFFAVMGFLMGAGALAVTVLIHFGVF